MAEWEDAPASKTTTSGWEDAPAAEVSGAKPVAKGGWEDAPVQEAVPTKDGEFVKGAKSAFEYGLPTMGRQLALQGSADAMVSRKKQLDLMGEIDSGKFKTLAELKADPAYDALKSSGQNLGILNTYFASRNTPDVAAKLRGKTENEFKAMATDSRTQIDMLNKYAQENKAKYGPRVEKFTDINWKDPRVVADFTDWLGYNMGSGAVQMAPVMLAAVVTKQPGLLATSGAMGVSEAVGNRMKFIQDKVKDLPPEQQGEAIAKYVADTGDANLITGLVSGSFDLILGPASKAAKAAVGKTVGKMAAIKQAAKELPKDVVGEAVTGGLQETTQIAAKKALEEEGLPITKQNILDVVDAAMAEGAGAPIGTAVNVGMAGLTTPSKTAEDKLDDLLQPETKVEPTMEQKVQPAPTPATTPESPAATTQQPLDLATAKTSTDANGNVWVMTGREEPTGNSAVGRPIWEKLSDVQARMEQGAQDEGATNVGQPLNEPSGVSAELAEQPNQVAPAAGVAEPTADGVVPTGANAEPVTEGAGVEPTALSAESPAEQPAEPVAEEQAAPTPELNITIEPAFRTTKGGRDVKDGYDVFIDGEWGNRYPTKKAAQAAVDEARAAHAEAQAAEQETAQPTEGAEVGAETPEAVQAEAQGQEAPAATAAGVTPEAEVAEPQKPRTPEQQQQDADAWTKANEAYAKSFASTKFKNRGIKQKLFEKMNPNELMRWVKANWDSATEAQREVMARLPSIDFLGDWTKTLGLPHISEAAHLMTALVGRQKVMAEETEQLLYVLKKAFKKDPTLHDKLSHLAYVSTNAEIDPSDPNATKRDVRADEAYAALGEEGQALYRLVKEHYEKRAALYLQLLENNIANMPGVEAETKQNLLINVRKHYEAAKRIQPYFALVRDDGKYWMSIGEGDNKQFYIYNSINERDADRARMMKEDGLSKDDFKVGDDVESLRNATYEASAFLRGIFDAIDAAPTQTGETDVDATRYKEGLKEAVYQTYLNIMPERSFRSMFRERKGRAGYRTDMIQNIASTDNKMNIQLARLEYGQQIRGIVDAAQSAIEGREGLQPFVTELRKRVDAFLSPEPHNWMDAIAGIAGRIGFTYMLVGLSLPLIQPFSLVMSGIPILWGNYKTNPAKAAAALIKAFAYIPQYGITTTMPDGSKRYHWPSLINSNTLKGDRLWAVKELGKSGVHESTLSRAAMEHIGRPTSSYVLEPGKELEYAGGLGLKAWDTATGMPFHTIEKWIRESIYLAAFDLGIADGLTKEEARDKAFANIKEIAGDYDTHAKPRWMQRGLGKMMFALKTFAVLITQQTLGNMVKMISTGASKEERLAASKKLSGIYLTTAILAGASGIPFAGTFYGMAAALAMALGGKDEDEDEAEKELRENDPGMWMRKVWMPRHMPNVEFGGVSLYDWADRGVVNAVTGFDVASRIQLATTWGQENPRPAKTMVDSAVNFVKDYFGGPYLSWAEQMLGAYNLYDLGDEQRAKEMAAPKPIKDWMKGNRYEEEGVKDSAGRQILEKGDLTNLELWGQRFGFAPDIITITQREGEKVRAELEKVRIARDRMINKLDIARRKDTEAGDAEFQRLLDEELADYNEKHQFHKLTRENIAAALQARKEARERAVAGVSVTKNDYQALAPLLDRMEERVSKRHEQMEKKRAEEAARK